MTHFKSLFLSLLLLTTCIQAAQAQFDRYFLDKTMRFDFYHCGDAQHQEYFFDELKEEPYWAGSKVSLIDNTGYGNQLFKIIDKASGKEIYSRSYCTLFNEWQTTPEASKIRKVMPESVVFPFPKNNVRIEIYARNRKMFLKRNSNRKFPQILILSKNLLPNTKPSKWLTTEIRQLGWTSY